MNDNDFNIEVDEDRFLVNVTATLEESLTSPDLAKYTFGLQRTIDMIYRFKAQGYSARYFYNIKSAEYSYVLTQR